MKKNCKLLLKRIGLSVVTLSMLQCTQSNSPALEIEEDARIVLIGNNLGSRMMNYGHFETEMQLRYPDSSLFIRNMSDGGNTPGFRPHSSRESPWAFPGAEAFQTELATNSGSEGHFPTPDEWLKRLEPDFILAFFGYNESFQGEEGLERYKAELEAFIQHTASQNYNEGSSTQLAIVSPIAFEDLSDKYDLPNGSQENKNLALYTEAMRDIAAQYDVHFADVYTSTKSWFDASGEELTIDGSQLNDEGYARF
ncbi:MAG: SGNH/GDSL hydrolase family protein, partial [Balneolales bacterium]